MWKNILEPGRSQMTIRRMRIVCWIPKATNTHSEYVIFIAFSPQQWLHERPSMLCYTYIACIVTSFKNHKCLPEPPVIFTTNSYVTWLLQTEIKISYISLLPTLLHEDKLLSPESDGHSRPQPVILVPPERFDSCQLETRTSDLKMASTDIFDADVNVVVQFLAAERQELFMNKKRKRR